VRAILRESALYMLKEPPRMRPERAPSSRTVVVCWRDSDRAPHVPVLDRRGDGLL